jgi:PAS domain S-box-containing protein
MAEGPGQSAPAAPGERDSVAPAVLDLRSHDWRSLIEQLPLTVYIDRLDESSSNVYTSPQMEAILGYAAEEWARDEGFFRKVLHPQDRERVIAAHQRSRDTGEPFEMEYRLIARDGRVVWFLDRATIVPDRSGDPAFHHGFCVDISERKALEHALAESAEELRRQKGYFESLLEISPVAIVTTDLEDAVTSWNPAAERLFGYARSEALGRRIDDLVADSPELRAEAASVTRRVLHRTRVREITRRAHRDGSLIDVELLAAPVVVGDELVGTYAIYHDIRELKRAEERYRALVEGLPLVTYVDEPTVEAKELYISPQIETLLGYSPQEWLADPEMFWSRMHPDDRERISAEDARTFAAGASHRVSHYRLLARDGRTVWVHDEARIVRDDQGVPLYVQGFQVDVSARKRAEDALRQSEAELRRQKQYFESLVEICPTAVLTLDLDERVTSWNPAAERLFGYSREEALGRPIVDLVWRAEDLGERAALLRRVAETGEARLTARRRRKDGTLVDVEIRVAALGVDGRRVGTFVIYHDISELLRLHAVEREYLEQVGHVVAAGAAVEDGSFDPESLDHVAAREDAIGQLARVFRRLAREHGVARSLAETADPREALARALRAIGESLGWRFGAVWEPADERPQALRCVETWSARGAAARDFEAASRSVALAAGEGLPGRVWRSGQPAWIADVLADDGFPRASAARRAGLHAAFCFPIRSARGVLGVIEFFSGEPRQLDAELLATMSTLGEQIGLAIERRRDAEALRAEEARHRAVLDAALDCVVTIDHQGRVVDFNPAAERTFGYRAADAVGRPLAELIVPPELRERHRRGLARYLATGEPVLLDRRLETTGMRADGSTFPLELAITRIDVPGPPQFTGYLRDITDRKAADAELRQSRSRIVQAADDARRRLERDLHDGAQQRLVTLGLILRSAQGQLGAGADPALADTLRDAVEELQAGLGELRALARGLHPAILTEEGLVPALRALVARCPVPVKLLDAPVGRLPGLVETAAYFVVSEALANVVKHAPASSARVSVERGDGTLIVEVIDDGPGGARFDAGSGLRGLADRVAAVDGRLEVHSPPRGGTRVSCELPCA